MGIYKGGRNQPAAGVDVVFRLRNRWRGGAGLHVPAFGDSAILNDKRRHEVRSRRTGVGDRELNHVESPFSRIEYPRGPPRAIAYE